MCGFFLLLTYNEAMKHTLYFLAILLPLVAVTIFLAERASAADSGACYNVNDPDARAYCLAKARQEPSVCYSIQRADLRSLCLAEVRK